MSRQESNKKILEILAHLVEKHPDQRFYQLLVNADVVVKCRDDYNVESDVTLDRLQNSVITKLTENV